MAEIIAKILSAVHMQQPQPGPRRTPTPLAADTTMHYDFQRISDEARAELGIDR